MDNEYLWWRDGIIYQIYPRSFCDSNGDGIGDLNGITSRLDYLQDLGIDAIWLSPIHPSPDRDFGYDISNYEDVDPKFGTLVDFDRLVAEAHQRNIRVILDGVFNHTSDQHPWFQQSHASKENPYRNWYIWRPGKDGRKPNNWQSVFGGDGWQFDEKTGEYYFHMFVKEQPDLNWRNPAVPRAILEAIRFWLDRGVDGFRLDVFNEYYKRADLPDNPPKIGLRGFDRQYHIYDVSQPEMMPFLADLRSLLDAYPQRYAVGETFLATPEQTAGYMGDHALHAAFNFEFLERSWSPSGFLRAIQNWEGVLGSDKWPNYVLNNHDNPRTTSRYHMDETDAQARLAILMLLTLRGTPFLYYGEEIGMRDIKLRRSEILDPVGKKYWPFHMGRDGCRSPMQWDANAFAGFSTAQPWLKVHEDYIARNVAAQQQDETSLLNFYKTVIDFRKSSKVLRRGNWKPLDDLPSKVLGYSRSIGSESLAILLNFSAEAQPYRLPGDERRIVLSTGSRQAGLLEEQIVLEPNEGVILASNQ
jgi:alpha-glucosidase